MWSCECSLLTDVLICAVYDFLFFTEASFKIRILRIRLDVVIGSFSDPHLHEKAPQRRPLSDVYRFLLHVRLPSPRPEKLPWCFLDA